jgi:fatty acid desaturase
MIAQRRVSRVKANRYRVPARRRESMAIRFQRNMGMLLLGIWLVLFGLAGIVPLGLPSPLMAVLALLAGVLILTGR